MRAGFLGMVLLAAATVAEAAVVHVKPTGSDANSGASWADAKQTVSAALAVANTGDEIWVAAGTYHERIRNRVVGGLSVDVALYGGFAGTEASTGQRDLAANVTVLDGDLLGSVVTIDSLAGPAMRIDGFRIRYGDAIFGGGISITGAAPTIENNDILGNQADHGGGIMVWAYKTTAPVAHARIAYNVIQTNRGGSGGGGIAIVGSSPEIRGNVILRNTTGGYGGGIGVWVTDSSRVARPWIANNFLYENAANRTTMGMLVGGGGVYATERNIGGEPVAFGVCTPRIQDNVLAANAAIACGGGIAIVNADTESAPIVNNTVVGNSGSGICWGNAGPTLVNNLVALNTWGMEEDVGNPVPETVRHNNVWGNTVHGEDTDFFQLADRTGSDGNVSADPLLARYGSGRLRLQPGSSCIDAGDDTAAGTGRTDVDGQPRILGAHVDIGADESDGTPWPDDPAIVRVSPTGDDAHDGSSWALAKRTVANAVDTSWRLGGGEVWVRAGTYPEHLTLSAWVDVYGGFAGNETARIQRVPSSNLTVLDGGGTPPVVSCGLSGYRVGGIDGFRITGGGTYTGGLPLPPPSSPAGQGGGVRCAVASPVIRGNEIVRNSLGDPFTTPFEGPGVGGGISLLGSHALVENNTIADNEALSRSSTGGGIYAEWSVPDLVGNTIATNRAPEGSAVYAIFARPALFRNVVRQNEHYYIPPSYFGSSVGAVALMQCWDVDITANTFLSNVADVGGAMYLNQPERGTVADNVFVDNWAYSRQLSTGGEGGAIWLMVGTNPQDTLWVTGNTFSDNHASSLYTGELGGAMAVLPMSAEAVIANNVMAFNSSGVYQRSGFSTNPVLVRNDTYNIGANYVGLPAGPSDVHVDPSFVDRAGRDFRLQSNSPVIDEGDPTYVATVEDPDGAPRVQDGDGDGTASVDLGAFEWSPDTDADGVADWLDDDDDDDGAPDGLDCAPLDDSAWTGPQVVSGLRADGSSPTVVSWTPQGADVFYDVVSGRLSELTLDGDFSRAACRQDDGSANSWTDTDAAPPPAEAWYYLARAANLCGEGGWGGGQGGPRILPACP